MGSHLFRRAVLARIAIGSAFAIVAVTTIAQTADAAGWGMLPGSQRHQAPYDNTGQGPQDTGLQGGGG